MRRRTLGRALGRAAVLAATGALAGCSFAPPYVVPSTPAVAGFKEQAPFTLAEPADLSPKGDWWTLYRDPVLTGLEAQIADANPTLGGALSRFEQAQEYLAESQAGLQPRVGLGPSGTYNRQSDNRPTRGRGQPNEYGAFTLSGSIDYELDLWGRVRNEVKSGRAEVQASAADLASLRLSLQGELADSYMRLRGVDAQLALLDQTIAAYARADALTEARHTGGIASGLDVGRAQAQLAGARAQSSDLKSQRALLDHAVAAIVGQPASTFYLAPKPAALTLPAAPRAVPSELLQRRPDIAAAERRVASANAQIGVAKAAFYPAITLDATGGFQNTGHDNLFSAGNTLWSFGPSAALSLFDAGRRRAQVRLAFAARDIAAANYRGAVLQAFQDVEDSLAQISHFSDENTDEARAVQATSSTEALAELRYRDGASTYLDVVVAQTAALQARQAALDLQTRRFQASVRLIRALGGGWTRADLPRLSAKAAAPPANTGAAL